MSGPDAPITERGSFTDPFVRRPVLSAVVSLVVLLLGVIALLRLPVRETPELQPPTVTVTTSWPGADPTLVETDVTEILEREINGIAGIRTLTSTSRDQVSQIVVEFVLERDLEEAANDVRARVARARRRLPEAVEEPIVEKADADSSPVVFLRLAGEEQSLLELSEIADTLIRERLQTVSGVSNVDIYGEQRYAMRIELDPRAMASRGVDLAQIERALNAGNVDAPGGRVEGSEVELSVRVDAGLQTPAEFEQLVVSEAGGSLVHLGELARVRLGAENERSAARSDGLPAISIAVMPQAQANIIDISDEIQRRLEDIRAALPTGTALELTYDRTEAVRSSIAEVEGSLFIAFGLVVGVIFLFLRDVRSTLIPAVAIPVSIVGTFLFLWALGFSINVFTLFGLVLAIGLVVDDAIVVLENIYRRIEAGEDPTSAALHGTRQIVFAILATTVSLVVVFLPIVFIGGTTGRLFTEFGATVAVSVGLSGVVALTLTPMLCAQLLRPADHQERFYQATSSFFDAMDRGFATSLARFARVPVLAFLVLFAAGAAGVAGYRSLPRELFPTEDRNVFMVRVVAPEGTSFPSLDARMRELEPELMELVPERKALLTRVATGGGGAVSPANTGMYIVPLSRKEVRDRTQQEIVGSVARRLSDLTAFLAIPSQPSILSRGPSSSPLQFVLQHADFDTLAGALPDFVAKMRKVPGLTAVNEDLRLNRPELAVTVDRDRAAAAGIAPRELARTLQVLTSALELSQFKRGTRSYPVLVSVLPEARATPDDLGRLELRTASGDTVPLANFATFTERSAASARYHFDRSPSATISANLDGISLGTAVERVQALAAAELPEGFRTALAGDSREFADSNRALALLFGLAVLLVYLTLAAQFDSFLDPVSILVSVPIALAGAFVGLWAFGMTLSFFAQVGLILLVGLVTKNGILIVEYAKQLRREQGLELGEAALQAARIRLRPVIMTSVSTVVGALPIALGFTSTSRAPLGVAVVCGMVSATVLTLYVTPVVWATLAGRLSWQRVGAAVAAGALLMSAGSAQAQQVLSLQEALSTALQHNLELHQQEAVVEQARAARAVVNSALLPSAAASGSAEYGTVQNFTGVPGGTGSTYRANGRLTVPLVSASGWSAARAAAARLRQAEKTAEARALDVLAEAGSRYVALARAEQGVTAAEALLARSRRWLALAEQRVEVGDAGPIEATRAALLAHQDEQRLVLARNERSAARRRLVDWLGLPLETELTVGGGLFPGPPDERLARPDLEAAELAAQAARADRGVARLGWVPQISGFGAAGYFARGDVSVPVVSGGLEADLPLFTGLGRVAAARQADAAADAAEVGRADLEREIAVQVAIADDTIRASEQAWALAQEGRALSEREVELAADRFHTGAASNVELVEAQGRLVLAVEAELDALATYNLAILQAWWARGTLAEIAAP